MTYFCRENENHYEGLMVVELDRELAAAGAEPARMKDSPATAHSVSLW